MPRLTYTEEEVDALIRVAYVTGIRDAVVTLQDHPLTERQATMLQAFLTERQHAKETVRDVHVLGSALALRDGYGWRK
ncbi:MAG TPA: hypothetical protein VMV29_14715 [Ktedonobacterales bacterium]|nr:hypothetical protein [Ktedonobacterales bacterium]